MTYQDILKLFASETVAPYVPDGTACSKAMFFYQGGKPIHRFFTYVLDFPSTKGEGPLSVFDIDPETGTILNYARCDEKTHKIDAAIPADKGTAWKGIKTYEALYPEVVALFEKDSLSEAEQKTVQTFREAFDQFISPDLKAIYTQLAPEMFAFLNKA